MAPALQRTRLRGKQAPTDPRVKKDTNVIKQVYFVLVLDLRLPDYRSGKIQAEDAFPS